MEEKYEFTNEDLLEFLYLLDDDVTRLTSHLLSLEDQIHKLQEEVKSKIDF